MSVSRFESKTKLSLLPLLFFNEKKSLLKKLYPFTTPVEKIERPRFFKKVFFVNFLPPFPKCDAIFLGIFSSPFYYGRGQILSPALSFL